MADFDPNMIKDMAKLKNVNEADELLRGMKEPGKEAEIKSEYSSIKEVFDQFSNIHIIFN